MAKWRDEGLRGTGTLEGKLATGSSHIIDWTLVPLDVLRRIVEVRVVK